MSKSVVSTKVVLPAIFLATLFLAACNPQATTTPEASPVAQISPAPENPAASPISSTAPTTSASPTASGLSVKMAAKTYDETVTYQTPGGNEEVRFMLSVDSTEKIVDAQAEVKGKGATTQQMQTKFKEALPEAVVGKQVEGLKVDRVGGASLTSGAFNKFLTELDS